MPCSLTTSSRRGRRSIRLWDPNSNLTYRWLCRNFVKGCEWTFQSTVGSLSFPSLAPFHVFPSSTHDSWSRMSIEGEDVPEYKEGWETITRGGTQVVVRTSAINETYQAFETLVIYVSTLGTHSKTKLGTNPFELSGHNQHTRPQSHPALRLCLALRPRARTSTLEIPLSVPHQYFAQ